MLASNNLTWPRRMRLRLEPTNSRGSERPSTESSPYLPPDSPQGAQPHRDGSVRCPQKLHGREKPSTGNSSEEAFIKNTFRVWHHNVSSTESCLSAVSRRERKPSPPSRSTHCRKPLECESLLPGLLCHLSPERSPAGRGLRMWPMWHASSRRYALGGSQQKGSLAPGRGELTQHVSLL